MKRFIINLTHECFAETLEEALKVQCDQWELDFSDGFRFPEEMEVMEDEEYEEEEEEE